MPKMKLNSLAEGTTMSVETIEVKAVEQVASTEEGLEILALSFDDLDLIGGGVTIGALC